MTFQNLDDLPDDEAGTPIKSGWAKLIEERFANPRPDQIIDYEQVLDIRLGTSAEGFDQLEKFYENPGYGAVIYIYKGKYRNWLESSISATPVSFFPKKVDEKSKTGTLFGVLIIRGTEDFALTKDEATAFVALLSEKLAPAHISIRGTFSTSPNLEAEVLEGFGRAADGLIASLNEYDFPIVFDKKEEDTEGAELIEGTQNVILNGIDVRLASRLKEPDADGAVLSAVSISAYYKGQRILTSVAEQL